MPRYRGSVAWSVVKWGRQMDKGLAVFFDIGDTLASAVVEGGRLSRLDVYRFIPDVLARLRAGGEGVSVSVGLISNTGDETAARMNQVLADAGLSALVDAHLCLFSSVEGLDKSQPAFFELARDRAAVPAARCLFVGENAEERAVAASVGFRVSPHPLHGLHLVESEFFAQLHA
jgi:FMN phosphatase YigB (HAD superfamily)